MFLKYSQGIRLGKNMGEIDVANLYFSCKERHLYFTLKLFSLNFFVSS